MTTPVCPRHPDTPLLATDNKAEWFCRECYEVVGQMTTRDVQGAYVAAEEPVQRRQCVPLETEEQQAFFARLESLTGRFPSLALIHAIPNAGGFSGGFGANVARVQRLKREGVKAGIPDIFVPIPRIDIDLNGLYIEMKRQNAVPSDTKKEQIAVHEGLRRQGYRVEICKGCDEAWAVLCDYLPWLAGACE